jgi:hypothetical protein
MPARAAFLAVRDDVRQALDEGWPLHAIWLALQREQRISFSYQTFCRFVNQLIVKQRHKGGRDNDLVKIDNAKEVRTVDSAKTGVGQVENKTTTGIRGFHFNPIAKKEDLV